ncbi:MAG: hypothetical protein ABJN65_05860, partial [Parasphingorhabdus sp.]
MSSKQTYCCFFCNQSTEIPVAADAKCECGIALDSILEDFPEKIGNYQIVRSLSRGFYGATYVVRKAPLNLLRVLKISPTSFYERKNTTIDQEIQSHVAAADGAEFIVQLTDGPYTNSVEFSFGTVDCYCTEMEFIDGFVLEEYCSGKRPLSSEAAIQISCDLISILSELQQRMLNHNDLHSGNIIIEVLKESSFRAASIDRGIRAKAIDLGSADSQRREGDSYRSDVQWIAEHLLTFSEVLARENPQKSDLRARVAFALRQRALELKTPQANQSDQPLNDIIVSIKNAYQSARQKVSHGWNRPFNLGSFSSHKNAQTLEPWFVPKLMVDPSEHWLSELHTGGPVVVTGMRGCGKTMLLRSLELHARIKKAEQSSKSAKDVKDEIVNDGYLGVFASARHLGSTSQFDNIKRHKTDDVSVFFARLFLVYAMNICDALSHLAEISPGSVEENTAYKIGTVVFGQIGKGNVLAQDATLYDLQTSLVVDAELWSSSDEALRLVAEPWNAFVLLARIVQSCIVDMGSPQIIFLLDDVSTRYLTQRQIELVVSTLLVQDPACSFKITSETQTFFLSIKSPAQINQASDERDYTPFDLGSKVLEKLKDAKSGEKFLEQILSLRMKAIGGDVAQLSPKEILGDVPLVEIARQICRLDKASSTNPKVYHGFSALRGVCIGDLGSVIALFQEIQNSAEFDKLPVPIGRQHDVFQTFCSNQLFQLNNRDGKRKTEFSLKKIALDFAQASFEEMQDSFEKGNDRLRQITSMHVTLEEGNIDQSNKLLELVDAGVFALHPRKMAARSKSKNADPLLQFHLSFRKILGISKLMGLSDRDRFELTGEQLLQWLSEKGSKDVLRRNTKDIENIESDEPISSDSHGSPQKKRKNVPVQKKLKFPARRTASDQKNQIIKMPKVETRTLESLENIESLVVSLGFEDRCVKSMERLVRELKPKQLDGIQFDIAGQIDAISEIADRAEISLNIISYEQLRTQGLPKRNGNRLIDASGLTKPAIYRAVKEDFLLDGRTLVAITEPEEYNPTEIDLSRAIGDGIDFWGDDGVEKLSDILSGDLLPYHLVEVDKLNSDPSRSTKLCAFGSAKHGRLIYLTGETTYDDIDVLLQHGDSSRNAVAKKAASIATNGGEIGSVIEFDTRRPQDLLELIFKNHYQAYFQSNSNFEIALTGGKMETVLSGIAGACLPINRVLYVQPEAFDPTNFSTGVGTTNIF